MYQYGKGNKGRGKGSGRGKGTGKGRGRFTMFFEFLLEYSFLFGRGIGQAEGVSKTALKHCPKDSSGRGKGFMTNPENLSSLQIPESKFDKIFKSKKIIISVIVSIVLIISLYLTL